MKKEIKESTMGAIYRNVDSNHPAFYILMGAAALYTFYRAYKFFKTYLSSTPSQADIDYTKKELREVLIECTKSFVYLAELFKQPIYLQYIYQSKQFLFNKTEIYKNATKKEDKDILKRLTSIFLMLRECAGFIYWLKYNEAINREDVTMVGVFFLKPTLEDAYLLYEIKGKKEEIRIIDAI